jgi:hypothetical protein
MFLERAILNTRPSSSFTECCIVFSRGARLPSQQTLKLLVALPPLTICAGLHRLCVARRKWGVHCYATTCDVDDLVCAARYASRSATAYRTRRPIFRYGTPSPRTRHPSSVLGFNPPRYSAACGVVKSCGFIWFHHV